MEGGRGVGNFPDDSNYIPTVMEIAKEIERCKRIKKGGG